MEHPSRTKFRDLCIETLMRFPTMQSTGNYYAWGGNNHRAGSDCSGHLVGMARELGYFSSDRNAQGMRNDCVNNDRPQVRMLGALYFYGSQDSNITHVTMGWDDLVAIGANNGSASTKTRAAAKSRAAGWQFCDPYYRSDMRGVYLPDWYPWVRVTTASLNLRDAASVTLGKVLAVLPVNTPVELLSDETATADGYTWVPVTANGITGCVASEYLKR